jgi:hypothetical protein
MKTQDQECCPEFRVEKWDKKTFSSCDREKGYENAFHGSKI